MTEIENKITKTGFFSKIENLIEDNWYPLALGLFSFPFWCLMIAAFGFIAGIPVTKYHAIVAFVLSLVSIAWACQWKLKKSGVHWSLFLFLLFCSVIYASFFTERAGDSIAYHKPASIDMKKGWIPLWDFENTLNAEPHKRDLPDPQNIIGSSYYWTNYYPKADGTINAVIYAFSGNIDLGGCTHILYLITVIIIVFRTLKFLFNLHDYQCFVLSLIAALNPIMLHLMFTGYIDGVLYDYLTILFFTLATYLKSKDKRFLFFVIVSITVVTNLKFTGVIYVSVFLFCIFLPYLCLGIWNKKPIDRPLVGTIGLATILALIVGINPYLYNLYYHHTPFYPVHSVKKDDVSIDFMGRWSKCNIDGANKVQQFAFAYLIPTDQLGWYPHPGVWKGKKYGVHNITVNKLFTGRKSHGYFGEFFIIPIWFSLLAMFFIRGKETWFFLIAIWASIFILPYVWYPRYIPHLWLIPVVVISSLLSQLNPIPEYKRRMEIVTCLMLLCLLIPSYQIIDTLIPKTSIRELASIAYFVQKEPQKICFDIEHLPVYNSRQKDTYYYVESLIPDWYPNYSYDKKINTTVSKKYLGNLGKCPVYLTADQTEIDKLKDFHLTKLEIVIEILKFRFYQFKRVWFTVSCIGSS
jgi:hypothetical protein